jgi:hypothetical protein
VIDDAASSRTRVDTFYPVLQYSRLVINAGTCISYTPSAISFFIDMNTYSDAASSKELPQNLYNCNISYEIHVVHMFEALDTTRLRTWLLPRGIIYHRSVWNKVACGWSILKLLVAHVIAQVLVSRGDDTSPTSQPACTGHTTNHVRHLQHLLTSCLVCQTPSPFPATSTA